MSSAGSYGCSEVMYNGGEDWYPYFYRQGGDSKGIVNDILLEATSNSHLSLLLAPSTPWKRQLLELKAGHIDFLAGAIRNQEREQYFRFSQAVSQAQISIFTRANKAIDFKDLSDLIDLRGVKLLGMSLGNEADEFAFENLVIDETLSVRSLFKMVEVGRADYGVMYHSAGTKYLNQYNLSQKIVAEQTPLTIIDIHIAATKKSKCPQNIDRVLVEIIEMNKTGRTKEIEKLYRENDASKITNGEEA